MDMTEAIPPDPYAVLGVTENADLTDIRSAYRKLVLKCHPDKVQNEARREQAQEEFMKVQQAYETIGNEEARQRYDERTKLAKLRKEAMQRQELHTPHQRPNPRRRHKSDTMEGLIGSLDGKRVVALCDTGADENFIAEDSAKELGLEIVYVYDDERPSFIMGHGRRIVAIGTIKATWIFERESGYPGYDVTLYVLRDCIFDVMIGSKFLSKTDTMTENRHRLSRIPKPGRALRSRVVNLCGTPSRRIRGRLKSEDCDALPDSGAEPNLLSYEYAKKRGWLLDMFPGPESCRLLQFADGSTETVDGRLRLQWNFVTGWGIAPPYAQNFVDFDVLRGCPFDVILGSDFLDDTEAFTRHQDSFQDVIQEGPSGLNIVIWVASKKKKESRREKRENRHRDEVDRELERRAEANWESYARKRRDGQLLVDELDFVNQRHNQWDVNRQSTHYQNTLSASTRRLSSPTRRSTARPRSPTRSTSTYPSHNVLTEVYRSNVPLASMNTPAPRAPRFLDTLYPKIAEVRVRETAPSGDNRTRNSHFMPEHTELSNRHQTTTTSRMNMRWTDTPYPSLARRDTSPITTSARETQRASRVRPHHSEGSKPRAVHKPDISSRDRGGNFTTSSPTRSEVSTTSRSSRSHSHSPPSLPRSSDMTSNTSISSDSTRRSRLVPTQNDTSGSTTTEILSPEQGANMATIAASGIPDQGSTQVSSDCSMAMPRGFCLPSSTSALQNKSVNISRQDQETAQLLGQAVNVHLSREPSSASRRVFTVKTEGKQTRLKRKPNFCKSKVSD